jgi:hypothetical protein
MPYELIPYAAVTLGIVLAVSLKSIIETIYKVYFTVQDTTHIVYSTALTLLGYPPSTALVIRGNREVMVQESYDTAVMLIHTIHNSLLVPIVNATKELMLLLQPALELVVVILKTLILVIEHASQLVLLIIGTVSTLLTSVFTTIQSLVTNTTATLSSWLTWVYEGTSDTFFNTILYLVGFYIFTQIAILIIKRLVKKIK